MYSIKEVAPNKVIHHLTVQQEIISFLLASPENEATFNQVCSGVYWQVAGLTKENYRGIVGKALQDLQKSPIHIGSTYYGVSVTYDYSFSSHSIVTLVKHG